MSGVALNTALPIIFAGSRYSKTEVQQNLLVLYDDVDLPMVCITIVILFLLFMFI